MSDFFKTLAAAKSSREAQRSASRSGSSLLRGPETVGFGAEEDSSVSGITGGVSNIDLSGAVSSEKDEGMKTVVSGVAKKSGAVKLEKKSDVFNPISGIHGGSVGTPGVSLVAVYDEPGKTVCCVPVNSNSKGGGDRACGEVLVDGSCPIKAHHKLVPVELPIVPAVFAPAPKLGRGGVSFYYDENSYYPFDDILDSEMAELYKTEDSSKAGWSRRFAQMRANARTGGAVKKLKFEHVNTDLLDTAFTPAKKREEDDLSPTGSEFSFEFVPEDYDEIPPAHQHMLYELLQDLKAVDELPVGEEIGETSTFLVLLHKIVENLYSNQQELNRYSAMLGDQATSRLNELVRKVNALAVAGSEFQRKIGTSSAFEDATGYSTVLDGLMGLYRNVNSFEETLRQEFKSNHADLKSELLRQIGLSNTRIETVDSHIQGIKEEHDSLFKSFTDTMSTLRDVILPDVVKMQMEYNEDPNKSLLQRVRDLEDGRTTSSAGVNLLSSLVDTGAKDKYGLPIGSASGEIAKLHQRLDELAAENAIFRHKINDLEEKPPSPSYATPEPGAAEAEALHNVLARVSALEGKGQEVVTILGYSFCGERDCLQFLKVQGAFEANGLFLGHDMVSLVDMARREGEALGLEEFMNRDDKTSKGGFNDLSAAAVYSSMQNILPTPLTLKGTSSTKPLPRVDTFDKWDQQDGEHGVRYEIFRGVENNVATIAGLIDTQLAPHAEARRVFMQLLQDARLQWAAVAAFLSDRRGVCFHQCGDEEDAWRYPTEVVRGLFNELHKVRIGGAMRGNLKKLEVNDAARMFWAVLRCHKLMMEFVNHKFVGHPKLSTYSLDYLFRNRLTTKNIGSLNGKVEKIQADVAKINGKLVKNKIV